MKDEDTPEKNHSPEGSEENSPTPNPPSPTPSLPSITPNRYVKAAQGRLHWAHGPTVSSLCLKVTFNVGRQDLQEMLDKNDLSNLEAELAYTAKRGVTDLLQSKDMRADFKSPANVDFNAGLAGGIKDGDEVIHTLAEFLQSNKLFPFEDMEWMRASIEAFKHTISPQSGFGHNLTDEQRTTISIAYLGAMLGAVAQEHKVNVVQAVATFAATVEDMIASAKQAQKAPKH